MKRFYRFFNDCRLTNEAMNSIHAAVRNTRGLFCIALALCAIILVHPMAHAATRVKQNNNDNLNLASSWDMLPGSADIALWSNIVTGTNTTFLGSNINWLGIKIVDPGGTVTIGGANTLTLGPNGIDMSTATQNLTLNCGLNVKGKQSWKVPSGRTLTLAGPFIHTGAVVDFTGFSPSATLGTLSNVFSILGPWATTGSGTAMNYVKSSSGAISAFTTQTAGTAGTLANVTSENTNYSSSASATLTGNIMANTLRFTGVLADLDNAGYSMTLNGLMNAGNVELRVSGTGNIVIGANKELVIIANTCNTFIYAPIVDNITGSSSLTYSGGGVLFLYGLNTYSGGTIVNAGSVMVKEGAKLGYGSVAVNAGELALSTSDAIDDSATVSIADGAEINLAPGLNEWVRELYLGNTAMPPGTYGSTISSAVYKDDAHFSGTGVLTVLGRPLPQGTLISIGVAPYAANWSTFVVTNALPFAEGFEGYPGETPVSGISGWMSTVDDASKALTQSYTYLNPFPLNTTHTNVLLLETEGQMLCALFETNAPAVTSHVWIDMMTRFTPSEDTPPCNTALAALFLNINSNLVLYAASLDSDGNKNVGWLNLTPGQEISPTNWYRITFDIMAHADGSNDFVRVFLDGNLLTHAAARVIPFNSETNGTWFCLARHEGSLVPSLGFQGTGYIDDLNVTSGQLFDSPLFGLLINGGIGSRAYSEGEQVTIVADVKAGRLFEQWTGATQYVASVTSPTTTVTMPAQDIILTAAYTCATYTVSFNPQSGTVLPTSKVVTFDSAYGELPTPLRTGYNFVGWLATTNGVAFEVDSSTIVSIAADHTLSANWVDEDYVGPVYTLDSTTGRYLSFDDYSLTNGVPPTWQHWGNTAAPGTKAGTNHLHISGWSFLNCRTGRLTTGTSIPPALDGNMYVPNTNYCAYFQNTLAAKIESPVFTNGIGTLYFDIESTTSPTILPVIKVYVASNFVEAGNIVYPIPAEAWEEVDSLSLNGSELIQYKKTINSVHPMAVKLERITVNGIARDNFFVAIDNIRVSEPPADVLMDKGAMPFNAYPSVNKNMNVQFLIANAPGPHATTAALRTNVLLVSRWNYLNQTTTPWVTNKMQCVDIGDGAGNGELWQPQTPLPAYSDAGDLEYVFLCYFSGSYYQSYDYTVYPKVLNPALFPPENKSPRLYSASGILDGSAVITNNPFVFPLRLFPSEHDTVTTLLYVNGSETPIALPMTLVGTNKWQAKYDVNSHPDVTNLLWYFSSTGTFTNAFMTTTGMTYWQNATQRRLQSTRLPQSGFFTLTDASITNRTDNWFGVTITPGESSYVIFNLDTTQNSYLAGRGEYQNFNAWNTGTAAQNAFTDAVDKYSKFSYSQTFTNGWQQSYYTGISNWFGTVHFTGQTGAVRVGPESILNQAPGYWNAGSFQYVTERTAINGLVMDAETTGQRRNQGIRLLGGSSGSGLGYFQGSAGQQSAINGVGTVTYKARLSRPLATDPDYNYNVAYRFTDMMRSNYMIRCYMNAVLASPETPSISIIAYYQSPRKFYEYRIVQLPDARDINGVTGVYAGRDGYVAHQIWKWNGSNTPQLLAESKRVNTSVTPWGGTEAAYDARVTTVQPSSTEFRLYTTLTPTPSVSIRVKFQNTEIPFPAATTSYEVIDSTSPILFGGYGFHSADCTLQVNTMTLNNSAVGAIDGGGTVTPVIGVTSFNQVNEWYWPAELYSLSGNMFAPAAQATTVKVLTGTSEFGPWTPFVTQTVNSYAYQSFTATTNAWNNLCARIQANDTLGVVVDGVRVGSWRGVTSTSMPSDNWKMTEGWMSYNATDKWYAHLDASQADPSLIQGVRSERILGLGSIAFDYRVITAPAQIKIQYTANAYPQDDSDTGWVDVTNLTFAAATGWTSANYYLSVAPATNIYVRVINNTMTNRRASVDLKNIVIWSNPTNSPNDWAAYNMKISDTETDKWWLDKKTTSTARSGYMNNSTSANIIPGRPMNLYNPYIMAPRLTHGLGTISFLARAFTTAYAAGNTNTSISVYATTDTWDKYKPDALWTKLYTFANITNAFYRPYSYSHPAIPNDIKAVKLVVDGVIPAVGTPQRVCLDEIVLTEEVRPGFEITNVKMLKENSEPTLQPFEDEPIAIEAQLTQVQSDPQEINLFVTYVLGTNTWGVTNAPVEQRTTLPMTLVSPGERIYRTQSSLIPPHSRDTVVQYCVWAEYSDNGTQQVYQSPVTANHFLSPPWYTEDLNQTRAPDWSPYYRVAATNAPLWLAPSVQNVPYTGGVFAVFVGAPSNWTATATAQWVMPAASSGSLVGSISCRIAPNSLKTARSANLTFACGSLAETVVIHQEAAPSNLDAVVEPTGFNWNMGGDMLWFEQTQTVKEGASALQSGAITNNQQSWVETTITGPGMLSFWWRVSSEGGYDLLSYTLDGSPQKTISGNKTGWVQEQVAIGTGPHVVRWTYSKDASGSEGNDCGWLDALRWSPENTLSGFALWTSNLGLLGNQPELFMQDRNHDGIANGFEYAFGTNLPLSSLVLNIRFINGKAIVEIPKQDDATLPYVDIRIRGSTNLLDWTLPMIPASDTTGKPSYKSWHETQGTTPAKAFFKLEAELK